MKLKTSLLALAATGAFVSTSYSQTVIDITGSTAGRGAVHTQIIALLSPTGRTVAWNKGSNPDATSASNAGRAIYKGTYLGNDVIIRTFWTGSAAGVRDVAEANQLALSYFATTESGGGSTAGGTEVASPTLAPASAETVSEIGFSDVFQTSTAFTANSLVQEDQVAVIPFKFYKNEGAPAGLTNMTPGAFRNLYGALGEAPLSMFTGNAANTTLVYSTGRDALSGTRITALAETGSGVFAQLNQYIGTVTSNVATLEFATNDGGYSSGGGVATLLGGTLTGGDALVGYVGINDGNTAATNGATEMSFNGVTLGTNMDLVRNGTYTFWGYLHQSSMTLSGLTSTFYNGLKTNLQGATISGLVQTSTMRVERAADGAPISPL